MTEKLSKKSQETGIPILFIKIESKESVLDEEGNVIQEAKQTKKTCWKALPFPPKPLRVRRKGGSKEFPFRVSASIGKKS